MSSFEKIIKFIRSEELYNTQEFIPLHAPIFPGREKEYVTDCIETTFVSSVGKYVDRFEQMLAEYTGSPYAVATVNGTAALHVALRLSGVAQGDEVITQPLTFIATANAIFYTGASPVFIDVDRDTMGLSPQKLGEFLEAEAEKKNGVTYNRKTGKRIRACIPMHTFGIPSRIEDLVALCEEWGIVLVEDAAESLGSFVGDRHTGTFGKFGTLSFNGNKTITTGGGGMILTADESLAKTAKHITTTAKIPHKWEYVHDMAGYNYRLTNLSAALGCAQMEVLDNILESKRMIAGKYSLLISNLDEVEFVSEYDGVKANYWLNAILLKDREARDAFLEISNDAGVMTRPIWKLMSELEMYKNCQTGDLENSQWLSDRVVNLPSSAIL